MALLHLSASFCCWHLPRQPGSQQSSSLWVLLPRE
jgi:hypothetical protein